MRLLLVMFFVAGCAQAGMVPAGGGPEATSYPARFHWSYDRGLPSAEGAQSPLGVYLPNPPSERLAATRTAMIDRPERFEGAVQFCVGVDGSTRDVANEAPSGDPKLDQVLRETVARWQFKPAELGGQRVEACSTATFVMAFQ